MSIALIKAAQKYTFMLYKPKMMMRLKFDGKKNPPALTGGFLMSYLDALKDIVSKAKVV